MKKLFLPLLVLLFAAACSNNKSSDEPEEKLPEGVEVKLWEANLDDSTGKLVMSQDNMIFLDTIVPQPIIGFLNGEFPRVQLVFEKISNDTLFVAIPDATYLTQQMGSSGPTMYFASAVYNLTEIPGIRYVSFNFEEGDHASPAVLTREDIKNEQ